MIHKINSSFALNKKNTLTMASTAHAPYYQGETSFGVQEEASPDHTNSQKMNPKGKVVAGAAVAGGLAGLVLVGPIVALLAAGGAAVATTRPGAGGNVARAAGGAAASVGGELKRIDREYKVVNRTSTGIKKGYKWVSKQVKPRN